MQVQIEQKTEKKAVPPGSAQMTQNTDSAKRKATPRERDKKPERLRAKNWESCTEIERKEIVESWWKTQ